MMVIGVCFILSTQLTLDSFSGSCCDGKTCTYKNAGEICSVETECSDRAMCNGNTSRCPQPSHKENFLECNRNSSICMNGVCSGKSVCGKFGLQPCFCKDKTDECKICCLSEEKCFPAQNITKVYCVSRDPFYGSMLFSTSRAVQVAFSIQIYFTMVPVSKNSPIRAGSYRQRLSYVKLSPVCEMQSVRFLVCKLLKN